MTESKSPFSVLLGAAIDASVDALTVVALPMMLLDLLQATALTSEAMHDAASTTLKLQAYKHVVEGFGLLTSLSMFTRLDKAIGSTNLVYLSLLFSVVGLLLMASPFSPLVFICAVSLQALGWKSRGFLQGSLGENVKNKNTALIFLPITAYLLPILVPKGRWGILFVVGATILATLLIFYVCSKTKPLYAHSATLHRTYKMGENNKRLVLLLILCSANPTLVSGAWLVPWRLLYGWNDHRLLCAGIAGIYALGTTIRVLDVRLMLTARLASQDTGSKVMVILLLIRVLNYLALAQSKDVSIVLFLLVVDVIVTSFIQSCAETLVSCPDALTEYGKALSATFFMISNAIGNILGVLIFIQFFLASFEKEFMEYVFIVQALMPLSAMAWMILAFGWGPIPFQFPTGLSDFQKLSSDNVRPDDKGHADVRPGSPALSTVVEEDDSFRFRRGSLGAGSEYSMDLARPFGNTVTEWDVALGKVLAGDQRYIHHSRQNSNISDSSIISENESQGPHAGRSSGGQLRRMSAGHIIDGSPVDDEAAQKALGRARTTKAPFKRWASDASSSPTDSRSPSNRRVQHVDPETPRQEQMLSSPAIPLRKSDLRRFGTSDSIPEEDVIPSSAASLSRRNGEMPFLVRTTPRPAGSRRWSNLEDSQTMYEVTGATPLSSFLAHMESERRATEHRKRRDSEHTTDSRASTATDVDMTKEINDEALGKPRESGENVTSNVIPTFGGHWMV